MANRKRNIQMKFYVTEDEKRLIDEKMSQLPTRRYGAYLRKMAIDGYIIYTDTADIKAFTCLLYTSDAADDLLCVDLGGRRIIKKKKIDTSGKKQGGTLKLIK